MASFKGISQGAIGGAGAGAAFGPYGAGIGAGIGVVTGALFGDDPARAERERLIRQLEAGGYDNAEMGNYYEQAVAPVEESMSNAAKSSAATYARRGLAGSGLQQGAQADIATRRAAQLRQAKLAAIQQATTSRRRRLLDALGGYGGLSAENQSQFGDIMGGVGTLVGNGASYYGDADLRAALLKRLQGGGAMPGMDHGGAADFAPGGQYEGWL